MARKLWIDTNVVIRIMTGHPQELAEEVGDMLQKVEAGELILRLNPLVVAECCWVLASVYQASPSDISAALLKFTDGIGIETEEKDVVQQALRDYGEKKVDFIDAYIAAHAKANPPEDVVTWDKHVRRLNIRHGRPKDW
ncbi:twitching motility protein PilT [Geobacillus genomosp. 3]|uniref:Twitching motility protein PilT n=1 Tax=Geobacillus genomosp. 3 TaxID=1921421 RepID=S5ZQC0_GEOG3|nr:PIN domain-containing protein [Geobacillus genomosp. 3]AGT32653.1 twitching motility protein PilT [Geobacillus genomosp. 3]